MRRVARSLFVALSAALLPCLVWAEGETLSVNFYTTEGSKEAATRLKADDETTVGLAPVAASKWLNILSGSATGGVPGKVECAFTDQNGTSYPSMSLAIASRGGTWYGKAAPGDDATPIQTLLYGFLDDSNGSNEVCLEVADIPFAEYTVYLYFSGDFNAGDTNRFPSYEVNGTGYKGDGSATVVTSAAEAWGTVKADELTEGVNTLVVPKQTAVTLRVYASRYSNALGKTGVSGARGCLAGIQIVNTGAALRGDRTWATPSEGSAWADGLSGFQTGDNVAFGANAARETVTLPAEGDIVGTLTVAGDYAFEGGALRVAGAATVAQGATLAVEDVRVAYLRLTPSGATGSGNNAYPGLAELIPYRDGTAVAWPQGTTIRQVNADGSEKGSDWTQNEPFPNALIDGIYGSSTKSSEYLDPEENATGSYTGPANNVRDDYNKWWPYRETNEASAVIALGAPLALDGYVVWSTDHKPRSPRNWKLEASSDGTTWQIVDTRAFSEGEIPAANGAYNGGAPFTLAATTRLTLEAGMAVKGTLAGGGVIEGAVDFAEGSALKVPADGVLTITGAVSGMVALDLSALATPEVAVSVPVLRAPEGLTLSVPEGYSLGAYASGAYTVYRTPPTWKAGADGNTWSNRERWVGLGADEAIPTSGAVEVNLGEGTEPVTLTLDTVVNLDTLLVQGTAPGTVAFTVEGGSIARLETLAADVTLPAAALPAEVAVANGAALTVVGDATLSAALAGEGTLRVADGTVTLGAEVDLSALATLAVGGNGTLDLNGQNLANASRTPAAVILDGGTLANTSTDFASVGPVTLTADSNVAADGELALWAPGNVRDDLTLAGHTLTKTGSGLLDVKGAELGAGTVYASEGPFRLNTNNGGDCTLVGTTLRFGAGASYTAYGWINLSGTVTLETDAGADVAISGIYLQGSGALRKAGTGTLTIQMDDRAYTGATTVSAGTLVFNQQRASTKGSGISIAAGATLRKVGAPTLTLSGQLSGAGTCAVAEGELRVSAANGNFAGTWEVAEGATLADTAPHWWPFAGSSAQPMVVDGTLSRRPTNASSFAAMPIFGTGNIEVTTSCVFEGDLTVTGTLTVNSGVTCKAGAINGPDIVCEGTLAQPTVTGAGGNTPIPDLAVTVAAGKTLSGTGTIAGPVTFAEGSVLDATAGALTVNAVTLPSAESSVTLKVSEAAAEGTEVLLFATAVDAAFDASAFAVEGVTGLRVAPNAEGTALVLEANAPTLPEAVGADGGALTEAAATALLAVAEAKGLTAVSAVTGRSGGRDLTADELSGALECLAGDGLVAVGTADAEGAPLAVAYEFGIAAAAYDPNAQTLTVTVRVRDAEGGATVAFAEGTQAELFFPDAPEAGSLRQATAAGASEVTFAVPANEAFAQRPFKARLTRTTP